MRLGLYGGSFNPIHIGHVEPVRAAARALGLDRVIYLPTGQPPHKRTASLVPAWRRFAMVELALLDDPGFGVSTFELDSSRPSYTVDTLAHFRDASPDAELHLLIGGDSFTSLTTWRDFERLPALAKLVVMRRGGEVLPPRSTWHPALDGAADAGRVLCLDNPPLSASATEIRRRLHADEPIPGDWLAPAVLSYIEKYGLYRAAPTAAAELVGGLFDSEESPRT